MSFDSTQLWSNLLLSSSPAAMTKFVEESAKRLTVGLQKLRTQKLLCDVVLSTDTAQHMAHQVILAAASQPLKDHIFAQNAHQTSPAPELSLPPLALQIELENLPNEDSVSTLLDEMYGQPSDCTESLNGSRGCGSDLLLQLQQLQAKGLLCDMLLTVGTEHFAAHQVILAAAGGDPFRNLILDGKKQLGLHESAEPQPLDLELRGVKSAEAVRILLDFLYARPNWSERNTVTSEVCKDVMHLASELKLPALKEQGLQWNRVLTSPPPPPLPTVDSRNDANNDGDAEDEVNRAEDAEDEDDGEAQEAKQEPEEPENGAEGAPEAEAFAERPEVFLKMRCIKFDSTEPVPMPPVTSAQEAAEAAGEIYNRQDTLFLANLVRVFWEWPIWLEPALQQSPVFVRTMDPDRFKRLIPFVAYQWKDGPWQQAYTRLGFDPRLAPDEALPCQVIPFKDEAFRGRGRELPRPSEDISFQKAPTSRFQLYQLEHLKDDEYISDLLSGFEPQSLGDFCDRRSGFLGDMLYEVILERLKVKASALHSKKRKASSGARPVARKARR